MATRTATRQGNGRGRGPTHANAAPDLELGTSGLPGQVVLVLQGGGALGAYQVGVYEALYKAGIEPDWVIGTSIGAINGALIAANRPENRLRRLRQFWDAVVCDTPIDGFAAWPGFGEAVGHLNTIARGVPGFFTPRLPSIGGITARVGVDYASYYSTAPLRETLSSLVDPDHPVVRAYRVDQGRGDVVEFPVEVN